MSWMAQVMRGNGPKDINNLKRKFGVDGVERPWQRSTRIREVIVDELSAGRMAPVFPQSIIATTAVLEMPPIVDEYGVEGVDLMAPIAVNQKEMIPKRGEWAVRINPLDYTSYAPIVQGRFEDMRVFTCANGIPDDYPIIFAGIMTNSQDKLDINRDDVGALDTAGTVSGYNTGPDKLYAGDLVYIGRPYLLENGEPAVKIAGTPKDKARFGTYRYRWSCVADAFNEVKWFVEDEVNRNSSIGILDDNNLYNIGLAKGVRSEMPLYQFMVLHFIRELALRAVGLTKKWSDADIKKLCERAITLMQKFDTSITEPARKYDNISGQTWATDNIIQEINASQYVTDPDNFIRHLYDEYERLKDSCRDRQHEFVKQKLMGKVMVTAESGDQLDVDLGNYSR